MFFLLEIRDRIKGIYQKFSAYFNVLFKFVFSLVLFMTIKSAIGMDSNLSSTPVCIGLSLVGAFVPAALLTFLSIVLCAVNLLKISYICTIIFVSVYIVLWLFVLRHSSKYGYVFLATPILIYIGAPFAVPLIFGMVVTPIGAVAIMGGVVVYFLLKICFMTTVGETKIDPDEILQLYRYIMNEFITNKEMYMYIILLVALTLLIYCIRTRKFDYSNEVAAIAGCIVNIILFILATIVLEFDISIVALILWSVAGALIGYVSAGFKRVLDYSSVENVQFEDDDYYYYVKAVPKLKVVAQQNKVKNITKINNDEGDDNDLVSKGEGEKSENESEFDDARDIIGMKINSILDNAKNEFEYDDEYED